MFTGIGQDSHAFAAGDKPLVLGGVTIPHERGLAGNSDADVVLHALCNAVSSLTGDPFLGPKTDAMCKAGITDSARYLKAQLESVDLCLAHIAVSIEARRPKLIPWIPVIREKVAELAGLSPTQVGITATSGEGLSAFGRGEGIMATVVISANAPTARRDEATDDPLLVLITCPDGECAERLASGLVREKHAACVQQTKIKSTYTWQDKLEQEGEILLLVKTRRACYAALESWVVSRHPYEVPQIVALPISIGLPGYLGWLVAQTG